MTGAEHSEPTPAAVVCLVTAPDGQARVIAAMLVEKRLAACVNVVPLVRSVYRWEGRVEQDDEALLIVKTTPAAVSGIDELLRSVHPYENFELLSIDVAAGSDAYLKWIAACVLDGPPAGPI